MQHCSIYRVADAMLDTRHETTAATTTMMATMISTLDN
jgi:hypothetical protein